MLSLDETFELLVLNITRGYGICCCNYLSEMCPPYCFTFYKKLP